MSAPTAGQSAARRDALKNIRLHLGLVRGELDDLWGIARDATSDQPAFDRASSREVADEAAFNLLQLIRTLDTDLETLEEEQSPQLSLSEAAE